MEKSLILDDNVRNRLAAEAYKDEITKENIKKVIQKNSVITNVPDFKLYTESDPNSGLDAYAIHFYDKTVNEVYFFVRGTEVDQFEDIYADAAGIAAGSNIDQLNKFDEAYNRVKQKIKSDNGLSSKEMKGLSINLDGHSLGGNQVTSLALKHGEFQTVRGLNDAPVNVYQMTWFDNNFYQSVEKKFKTNNIYSIDEKKLLAFAADYYEENSRNITHVRVKGEPLYTQSFPGKFYPGKNIQILEPSEATKEFPDVSTYPLKGLAKFSPLFRYEQLKYDFGVSQIIGSLRYIDEKFDDTAKASVYFDDQLKLWNDKEYWKLFKETFDITSRLAAGAGGLISNPFGAGHQFIQINKHQSQMHYHSIDFLSELYVKQVPKLYYQNVDGSSGETILLEKQSIKEFIIGCYQALEMKINCIEELDNYIENTVNSLYDEALRDLNKKLDQKEANPEAFNQEVGAVSAGFFGRGTVVIDSLSFERDFESMRNSVTQPLYKMREALELQKIHLEKFIHKVISVDEKMFELDEELAAIIRKIGG